MAPATCGVACEVPDMFQPAASMDTPGAHNVIHAVEFEKHATWPAAVVASLHTLVVSEPTDES